MLDKIEKNGKAKRKIVRKADEMKREIDEEERNAEELWLPHVLDF